MCAQFHAFLDSLVADRSVMADRCRFVLPCASRDAGLEPEVEKRRGRKPYVCPCKVAPAGDERYLVCAAGAAALEPGAIGSSSVFCNEWLFMCA